MKKDKSFEFETAMAELEKVVKLLESESESLEKSLILFESGMKLTESLKSHLDEAEQRIQNLKSGEAKKDKSIVQKTND